MRNINLKTSILIAAILMLSISAASAQVSFGLSFGTGSFGLNISLADPCACAHTGIHAGEFSACPYCGPELFLNVDGVCQHGFCQDHHGSWGLPLAWIFGWGHGYSLCGHNFEGCGCACPAIPAPAPCPPEPCPPVIIPAPCPPVVIPAPCPPVVIPAPCPPVVIPAPRPPVVVIPAPRPPVVIPRPRPPVVIPRPRPPVVVIPAPRPSVVVPAPQPGAGRDFGIRGPKSPKSPSKGFGIRGPKSPKSPGKGKSFRSRVPKTPKNTGNRQAPSRYRGRQVLNRGSKSSLGQSQRRPAPRAGSMGRTSKRTQLTPRSTRTRTTSRSKLTPSGNRGRLQQPRSSRRTTPSRTYGSSKALSNYRLR